MYFVSIGIKDRYGWKVLIFCNEISRRYKFGTGFNSMWYRKHFTKISRLCPSLVNTLQGGFCEKNKFHLIKMIMKIQEFTVDLEKKKSHRDISNVGWIL